MKLRERIASGGYEGYAYAYPHKTSYRSIEPAIEMASAWSGEDKSALFLYVHVPYCEMRCGFCNLFTSIGASRSQVGDYLQALERQSESVAHAVGPYEVAQMAFGGGTPSVLELAELERIFETLRSDWPFAAGVPCSFEVSPGTVEPAKLKFLFDRGVDRISMGVQSFVPEVLKALGRPQKLADVERACDQIAEVGFRTFNIDLIYGVDGQTEAQWLYSLRRAVDWQPQELYLYPLYVRQLTGLGKRGDRPSTRRRRLYQLARDFLVAEGYQQVSMRLFRKSTDEVAPSTDYCCQEDGMVGLGPGARSYTRALHYSTEYAVAQGGVRRIIDEYCQQSPAQFARIRYGAQLDEGEQRRRYVIKSLLHQQGIDRARYRALFDGDVVEHFAQLRELFALELCEDTTGRIRLNAAGLAHTDTIGPWLYSPRVVARMENFRAA